MSILKLLSASIVLLSVINCSSISPPASSKLAEPEFAQADSYFLYAYALRDAKVAKADDATIHWHKNGKITFYTFRDHIIKECGTHLNGVIKITAATNINHIQAKFPKVTQNPLGITQFTFSIHEDPANPKNATGTTVVNGKAFNIEDIIRVSGF